MPNDVETQTADEATAPATPGTESTQPATSNGSAPAPANGTSSQQPPGSLTPPNTENASQPNAVPQQQPPANPVQQPDNWQKRYSDLRSTTEHKLNQAKQEREKVQQELGQLREFRRQQQEAAERQNLRPWSKQHPDNPKFTGLLQRAKAVSAQLRNIDSNLPPEMQQAARAAILSALSPDEQKQIGDYQESVTQFQHSFLEDPHGALAPIIQPMISQALQQERTRMQAELRIGQDFEDPELKPLIEAHQPEIAAALQRGVPYPDAIHMLKLYGQLEKMQTQMSGLGQKAAMGQEQIRLAQGSAAITRDPAPAKNVDVYSLAKKQAEAKGWSTADPRFLNLLAELEKANRTI